jgi:16S rRNA (cytosine1402-N4)-methyltransferase
MALVWLVSVMFIEKNKLHVPVLLQEVLQFLAPVDGGVYVDATFGGGGYTKAILDSANCSVIALDRDLQACERANEFLREYSGRFKFTTSNFSEIDFVIGNSSFDGIVFDFGVSSFQLEDAIRGFSFQIDGPLDMRMGNSEITAYDVVNFYAEEDIARIIKFYGEERFARRISHAIIKNRPLNTTIELANVVRSIVPKLSLIDPATKTFQALRIFVNDELREIDTALNKIVQLVKDNGIQAANIVTVAFHSLEDRIVKNWIRNNKQADTKVNEKYIFLEQNVNGVVVPKKEELLKNPRSRSARLRSVVLKSSELV